MWTWCIVLKIYTVETSVSGKALLIAL